MSEGGTATMQNMHDGSKQTLIMIVDDDAALGGNAVHRSE